MYVQTIRIEADEDGWELHLLTDDGTWRIFNIHGNIEELEREVQQNITPYLDEGGRVSKSLSDHHRAIEAWGVNPDPSGLIGQQPG